MLYEPLENRRLMSVSFNAVTHAVTATGTAGHDTILVNTPSPTTLRVTVNGVGRTFARSAVWRLNLNGLAGNDSLRVSAKATAPCRLDGGAGVDYLLGGGGRDTLLGGEGNDVAEGGAGDDELFGGNGNDTLRGNAGRDALWGGAGTDTLDGGFGADDMDGGGGSDFVDYSRRTEGIEIHLDINRSAYHSGGKFNGSWEHDWESWPHDIDLGRGDYISNIENARGGSGDDTIYGTAGRNTLRGNGGNDRIDGRSYFAGPSDPGGSDTLIGDAGDDTFHVHANVWDHDYVGGGAGTDRAYVDGDAYPPVGEWDEVEDVVYRLT